ncbi:lasso peptide biosynthesis B2 protein [Cytophagaceae bacterium 50C-KIRBA]|uniref:Lasso peptide biosynthesis B2 protein n=1 Tax=Aquirufa beregesia TaxID=2516556 RepID=A0ABX0EYY5_9BACT|nr:lasso peptide biosynthesis B2 protein [Aquirufa beregesia]NGZ44658.1 lasso peptide biosynthesis B2 protein [Aquirufa beregesia]
MSIPYKWKEIGLFIEAWIYIALARMSILVLSFEYLMKLIGKPISSQNWEESNKLLTTYIPINQAIERASRYAFWRTKCFEQALTAKWMLERRGQTTYLYFGVRKEQSGSLTAHAWLVCDGEIVTGGNVASEFQVISCFY